MTVSVGQYNQVGQSRSPAIVLQDVHKSYVVESHRVEALRGVSLSIPAGALVAITGRSGSGKSTLLHLIGTLDRPSSGRVVLGGTDVSTMDDLAASVFRNCTIGFVFQMNNLLPEFTAVENVMMPGIIAGTPRAAALDRAGMLLNSVGLGSRMHHRPGELSGGEQQRVAIARALFMAPPILLADEPTGNLDKTTGRSVQELLIRLAQETGSTMLLVTHDGELAARFPSHMVMDDGRVVGWEKT